MRITITIDGQERIDTTAFWVNVTPGARPTAISSSMSRMRSIGTSLSTRGAFCTTGQQSLSNSITRYREAKRQCRSPPMHDHVDHLIGERNYLGTGREKTATLQTPRSKARTNPSNLCSHAKEPHVPLPQ